MVRISNVPSDVVLHTTVYTQLPFPLEGIVHIWLGLLHGYPWCCIADFIVRYTFDLLPSLDQYDASKDDGEGIFTPCPFHARKEIAKIEDSPS